MLHQGATLPHRSSAGRLLTHEFEEQHTMQSPATTIGDGPSKAGYRPTLFQLSFWIKSFKLSATTNQHGGKLMERYLRSDKPPQKISERTYHSFVDSLLTKIGTSAKQHSGQSSASMQTSAERNSRCSPRCMVSPSTFSREPHSTPAFKPSSRVTKPPLIDQRRSTLLNDSAKPLTPPR